MTITKFSVTCDLECTKQFKLSGSLSLEKKNEQTQT